MLDADRGWDASSKHWAPQEGKACRMRIGGGMRPTSNWPRKERKLVGCGSGAGRVQQVSDPARGEGLLDADRGWDASNKSQTPQGGKACWMWIGVGTRPARVRPRKERKLAGRGSEEELASEEKRLQQVTPDCVIERKQWYLG